jgi:hypothetical protein
MHNRNKALFALPFQDGDGQVFLAVFSAVRARTKPACKQVVVAVEARIFTGMAIRPN